MENVPLNSPPGTFFLPQIIEREQPLQRVVFGCDESIKACGCVVLSFHDLIFGTPCCRLTEIQVSDTFVFLLYSLPRFLIKATQMRKDSLVEPWLHLASEHHTRALATGAE